MKTTLIFFSLFLLCHVVFAQYNFQPVFPNLPAFSAPTDIEFIPDGSNRCVVLEQRGNLWIFDNKQDVTKSRLFFDGKSVVTQNGCEAGLLGCAFHPDYANNHYVFLSYDTGSDPQWYSRIVRYQVSSTNPDSIIPSSALNILTFAQPLFRCNHKGGCLRFGPDGYLYASFGDGGSGGDPDRNGQNKSVFLGKILRIDVDHEGNGNHYAIPLDNPFANNTQGFKKEIYAYGLRNTWKFSFDKSTGKLWAGDVGQDAYEEVDTIFNGGNYGWNVMEGFHCYPYGDLNCDSTGMTPPVWEYAHDGNSLAITGGFIYRGSDITSLLGKYIYGDEVAGKIWALTYDGSSQAINQLIGGVGNVSAFGEDESGEIYALSYSAGSIFKLLPQNEVKNSNPASKLSLLADRTLFDYDNPATEVHFTLSKNEQVSIATYDESGKELLHNINKDFEAGEYSFRFTTRSLPVGIYFIRLITSSGIVTQKIEVLK